jgi:Tol biopolymer transport system component
VPIRVASRAIAAVALIGSLTSFGVACAGNGGKAQRGKPATIIFDAGAFGDERVFTVRVRSDESRLRRLTPAGRVNSSPDWSPDGSKIAYISTAVVPHGGISSLWTMRADGSGKQQVSRMVTCGNCGPPRWSPDGTHIAFVRYACRRPTRRPPNCLGDETFSIWVVGADRSGAHAVTKATRGAGQMSWSPDSKQLAYASLDGIRIADAAGTHQRLLASPPTGADISSSTWSPDGEWIAYCRSMGFQTSIWLIHPDGCGMHLLARQAGGRVGWSPDGKRLAFTTFTPGPNQLPSHVATIERDGTRRRVVSYLPGTLPAWSADGAAIAYANSADGFGTISTVRADGRGAPRVIARIKSDAIFTVAWQPSP